MAPTRKATKTHDVMGRPRHRLFGVFDDPAVGRAAVEEYSAGLHAGEDDIWILYGEEGLQKLDVSGGVEGLRGRIVRIVELAMSSDIGYLRTLEDALESGGLVISSPTPTPTPPRAWRTFSVRVPATRSPISPIGSSSR